MRIIEAIMAFVYPEGILLGMTLGGFLIMIGFRELGKQLFLTGIAMVITIPFIDSIMKSLPPIIDWALLAMFIIVALRFIVGGEIANHILKHVLYAIIAAPFRFLIWLVKLIVWFIKQRYKK